MAKHDDSVFNQIKSGLEDVVAFYQGKSTLRTAKLPAPPPDIRASRIRRLRSRMKMSQGVFAATLNVSVRTVQSWEQGRRKPSDAALRLLQVLDAHPGIVRDTVGRSRVSRATRRTHRGHATGSQRARRAT